MPKAKNTIATRQLTERLFERSTPLGAGEVTDPAPRLVAGYDAIAILAVGSAVFEVSVEQACQVPGGQQGPQGAFGPVPLLGPFTETNRFTAVLDATSGLFVVCQRVKPCGSHMRVILDNSGGAAQTTTSFCAYGIPEATVGVGGGGLQGTQGPQGLPGGVQGFQGPIGPQGNQGNQGPSEAGTQGPQGNQGPLGFQGNQGNQGVAGTGGQGPQGNQGPEGTGGESTAILAWGGDFPSGGATRFLNRWHGGDETTTAPVSLGAGQEIVVPEPGTLRDLFLINASSGAVSPTVMVNGVATGITIASVAAGTTGSETVTSVAVAQGDTVGVRIGIPVSTAGLIYADLGYHTEGTRGPQGHQGFQGLQGNQGNQGNIGTGSQGPQGPSGGGGSEPLFQNNQENEIQTTDATTTTLITETLPDDTVAVFRVVIDAFWSGDRAGFVRTFRAHRAGGGGAVIGIFNADYTDDSSGSLVIAADASGNDVRVRVTGIAATTIDWKGRMGRVLFTP